MNQVATIEQQQEINSLLTELGGSAAADMIKVPFLKIQYEDEDKQGREVKRGTFLVTDQGETVYATSVKLHVMAQYFQYRQSDPNTYKLVNKTILQEDFRKGEPIDMKGSIRCGRPTSKGLSALSDDEQKDWRRKVRATRILRGVVSYTGKTADGEEKTLENVPCQMYLKGMSYNSFDSVINALPFGKKYQEVWVNITNKKEGKAYVPEFAIDFGKPAVLDEDAIETLKLFRDMARQENDFIKGRYSDSLISKGSEGEVYDAVDGDLEIDF